MSEDQAGEKMPDIKKRVMGEIKSKKIRMCSHAEILAKKLGMEGAIVASILLGALIISIIFYIFEKTKVLRFFFLGMPGLKVILMTIPYGYITVFAAALILTLYLASKLDLCYETRISSSYITLLLLGATCIIGIIFITMGVHNYFKDLAKNKAPRGTYIYGRVENFSGDNVKVEEEDGRVVNLKLSKKSQKLMEEEGVTGGRYLRAVGTRNPKNSNEFRAEEILCCDED
jgi:hypothetical protein